jgi:SAM-dependent methyltransferase
VSIHPSARGFETAADDYERARPDYPDAAGQWLAEQLDLRAGRRIVDLAAGTGKLTRVLAATGADVVAIEPVAEMRALLAAVLPGVESLDGVAERIPLDAASVDAAAVAQAFHWFDGDRALEELHRVVRERGRLAVVYNRRPLDDPIQAGLEEIMSPVRGDTPAHRSGRWRDAFDRTSAWAPVAETEIRHRQRLDREGVVARAASVSFVARLPDERRHEVLAQVRALVRDRSEPIDLPYTCEMFVWQRA